MTEQARPRVLVTRAARDAARWVAALQRAGLAAQVLPLIAIAPVRDAALQSALQQARSHCANYRALMFVSGNAAHHFFEQKEAPGLTRPAQAAIKTRFWAPGPGTVQALLGCGVPAGAIDGPAPQAEQFESETLWQQVAHQIGPGDRVLIVRGTDHPAWGGGHGRNWLATQIEQAGGQVDFVASYERCAPVPSTQDLALALAAASDGSIWLLSSNEALRHLLAWLPAQRWGMARAVATHPRIAQAARDAGFGQVATCRPTPTDVVASIESLHEL